MDESREGGLPEGSNSRNASSPFPFLEGADEEIVNIVHSAVMTSRLISMAKHQVIAEALSETQRDNYWSWRNKLARQVPDEILRLIPDDRKRDDLIRHVHYDEMNKALNLCYYNSREAETKLRAWNEKKTRMDTQPKEWMDFVFDSAKETLTKWNESNNLTKRSSREPSENQRTEELAETSKSDPKPHVSDVGNSSSSHKYDKVPEVPPRDQSKIKLHEDRNDNDKYQPKVSEVEPTELVENQPVRPPRKSKTSAEYHINDDRKTSELAHEKRSATTQSLELASTDSNCHSNCEKQQHVSFSKCTTSEAELYHSSNSNVVSYVSSKPPPPFHPDRAYGNQLNSSLNQFGNLPPGAVIEKVVEKYKITLPGAQEGHNQYGTETVSPLFNSTVEEIPDNDAKKGIIEDKNTRNHPQDADPRQAGSSTSESTEFKKFYALKALNILLLGETGVGKTTFVNSLANYLKYNTLAEALAADPVVLVDASFVQGFENGDSTIVSVTSNSGVHKDTIKQNEHLNDAGASCTQSTVEHVFTWDDCGEKKLVRIIDTPGINDTRGADKDRENLNDIMKHISVIGELHAICILMKPNEAKLKHSFRSCIDYLLKNLHRSATTNILFCFTMTRSNMYRPGDSLATLRAYLNQLERETGVLIRADSSNLFSFENDCFRYMCAVRQLRELDTPFNMKTFSEGWKHNVPECVKMFKRVQGLSPHAVEDTVSINETRRLIENIVRPLADLARRHLVNIKLLQEYIDTVANPDQNGDYLASKVYQEQMVMEPELLPFPQTVCNSPSCVDLVQVNKFEKRSIPRRPCHANCALASIVEGRRHEKELKHCSIFYRGGYYDGRCSTCGCHWSSHLHTKYTWKYETKMVVDQAAKMRMDNFNDREMVKESILAEQKEKLHQMELENDQIRDCCAEMAAFLQTNSMKQGCDPYNDNLKQLLEEETNKCELGQASFEMAVALDNLQSSYNKRVQDILKEINEGRRNALTTAELNGMIDALVHMQYAGPTFARLRDIQMSTDSTIPSQPPADFPTENRGNTRTTPHQQHSDSHYSGTSSHTLYLQ